MTFLYDGIDWRWESTNHFVDKELCNKLTKEYKKYTQAQLLHTDT